ncbi:MAG TPA: hypothetical protein VKT70_10485, partial [Stellaceae bacterium]|nr:hypothetical protein [Stellaceae bacterium]
DGAGITFYESPIFGAREPAASRERKETLHRTFGAAAIDMESHLVAAASARAGIPFLVLRAVADPATKGLPPAALVGLRPDGTMALGPVLRSLAVHPAQLPALLRLYRETRLALRALRRGVFALAVEARHGVFDMA